MRSLLFRKGWRVNDARTHFPTPVKNQRFLPPSPRERALGRVGLSNPSSIKKDTTQMGGVSLLHMHFRPHPCRVRPKVHGFSHGLTNSPPDCWLPSLWSGRPFKSLLDKKGHHPDGWCPILAEKEGFEPSKPFWGLHDFQSCALGQLRDFSKAAVSLPTRI